MNAHRRCVVRQFKHSTSKHYNGGHVAVAVIVGRTKILLIKETTKPTPHFWKFISETLEPDEPVLNALWGGLKEEAGLDLKVRHGPSGDVVEFVDERARVVELCEPHLVYSRGGTHTRHFFGVETTDEVVMSLSSQKLVGGYNEEIETQAFNIAELDSLPLFHPHHRELLRSIKK